MAEGVGGANLSEVFAQDHAPTLARTMSKFREFGENRKTAFRGPRKGLMVSQVINDGKNQG